MIGCAAGRAGAGGRAKAVPSLASEDSLFINNLKLVAVGGWTEINAMSARGDSTGDAVLLAGATGRVGAATLTTLVREGGAGYGRLA